MANRALTNAPARARKAQRTERRTHPRATADRKARPPARDANGDARARTRDQFVRNALRRSLARLRSDEDPGRAASASSSDDRTLAKGGFGGCRRRGHPPSARARAVSGGFFFLLFAVLPDRDLAISRDRDLARDGWRRRSRESRESRYGSSQSSDWSRLEAWDPSTSYDSSHGETRVGRFLVGNSSGFSPRPLRTSERSTINTLEVSYRSLHAYCTV